METKEAILATITEFNSLDKENNIYSNIDSKDEQNILIDIKEDSDVNENDSAINDELDLLLKLKEKSLVLFEGLKMSKNQNIAIKLEMVISYLEYQLYMIEDRINTINKSNGI